MMNALKTVFIFVMGLLLAAAVAGAAAKDLPKKKIIVVSSYNREYTWSQDTSRGFCDAMLKFGYFDNQAQAEEFAKTDFVETSRAIVRKLWMDAKRKNSKAELARAAAELTKKTMEFHPDLLFVGDDDAAQYVATQFLDMKMPVVF